VAHDVLSFFLSGDFAGSEKAGRWLSLTDAQPVSFETRVILPHAYDGTMTWQ